MQKRQQGAESLSAAEKPFLMFMGSWQIDLIWISNFGQNKKKQLSAFRFIKGLSLLSFRADLLGIYLNRNVKKKKNALRALEID